MAVCHVAILARETFLGNGNPDFNESNFSDKFGSKYMSCRKSQNRPLRKLVKLAVGIVDFKSTEELQVHYDHPEAETKGCGWSIGCSLGASFPFDVSDPLHAADFFAGGGGMI